MGTTRYRKNASKSASGGNRWYVSGRSGSNPIKNKSKNKYKAPKYKSHKDEYYFNEDLGVNINKRTGAIKKSDRLALEAKLEANKSKEYNVASSLPLNELDTKPSNALATLDINQINKDRRLAAQEFGGIGTKTKEVTNFMSDDKWNMLTKEQQDNLNKKWSDRNTEYFATERGAEGNIFDGTLEERDEELRRLQAGD
tara:strand:+ start:744 stop:1337 length:594 start_codon:yes stop_codon:yes gene_type:complete